MRSPSRCRLVPAAPVRWGWCGGIGRTYRTRPSAFCPRNRLPQRPLAGTERDRRGPPQAVDHPLRSDPYTRKAPSVRPERAGRLLGANLLRQTASVTFPDGARRLVSPVEPRGRTPGPTRMPVSGFYTASDVPSATCRILQTAGFLRFRLGVETPRRPRRPVLPWWIWASCRARNPTSSPISQSPGMSPDISSSSPGWPPFPTRSPQTHPQVRDR
jgi:hypothetical protein